MSLQFMIFLLKSYRMTRGLILKHYQKCKCWTLDEELLSRLGFDAAILKIDVRCDSWGQLLMPS